MTATADRTATSSSEISARRPLGNRIYGFLRSIPTWFLWILVLVWSVPTFSLFVNSFRTRDAQRGSGFWNALGDESFPTLDNYREVLFPDVGAGLWNALLNSASIAIVATIIPIPVEPALLKFEFPAVLVLTALLPWFFKSGHTVSRREGAVLIFLYVFVLSISALSQLGYIF